MRERPIPFQPSMVCAVLAGTKTQTRRRVRVQPWASCCIEEGTEGETPFVYSALGGDGPGHDVTETRSPCRCPYGVPGDQVWVREAWRAGQKWDTFPPRLINPTEPVWYEAQQAIDPWWGKLRPSMFMPRWASRIQLEVTDVRVERLQKISEADAIAEGIPEDGTPCPHCHSSGWIMQGGDPVECDARGCGDGAVDEYRRLWESINGAGSWEANPWVWVVSFKRVRP